MFLENMSKDITYYDEKIIELIGRLKNQVDLNMEIVCKEVESSIGEEKYLNVLKGRKLAVSYCLSTLNKIDLLTPIEESYRRKTLPTLIEKLKKMVDINLKVIDLEIDEEVDEEENYKTLTEDKLHLILKARDTAGVDTESVLRIINDLEKELNNEGEEVKVKKSWAKIAADSK